jgi:flavin-dependent dehydrogenase
MTDRYDVIVVGSGSAGSAAAITAGRLVRIGDPTLAITPARRFAF